MIGNVKFPVYPVFSIDRLVQSAVAIDMYLLLTRGLLLVC